MENQAEQTARHWTDAWLNAVVDGSSTMSQRKLSSIIRRGGGLETVRALAQEKGVHLLEVTDDRGDKLIAASMNPFTVIC